MSYIRAYPEKTIDFSAVFDNNYMINIFGEIGDSQMVIECLTVWNMLNPDREITITINSEGGSVSHGLAIYDFIQSISNPVTTIGVGECCSMGAILLMAGQKRLVYPNTWIMIDQPSWGAFGEADDLEIAGKYMARQKTVFVDLISKHTGKTQKEVRKALTRDKWFNAAEAVEWGLADRII